jgi:endonuclease YncB( thermonuclease family)
MLKRFILILLMVCIMAASVVYGAEKRGRVRWVVDGDTVVLMGGERLRYAGINTPEVAHDGEPG